MMKIDAEGAALFSRVYQMLAADSWIRYQWFRGLAELSEFQDLTKADQPNWSKLTIRIEPGMLSGILTTMDPDNRTVSPAPLAVRYVQRLLEDQMNPYGVEPEIVRAAVSDGDAIIRFKLSKQPPPAT